MLRKLHLLVFLGLVVVAVLPFGLTAAGAVPVNETRSQDGEGGGAQERLAGLRMETGAAYEAHGNAVFQLGGLDTEIAAATEDLTVAEADLGEAQARLEDRASRMYKSGNVGFIDVLVGAESFNEFANRLELWVRLLARERAEFDRVREIRDEMAQRKAELKAARVQRVAAVEEADGQLDRTAELEAEAQAYLDSLDAETREAVETEQARGAEQARAEGERIRREIAEVAPEAVSGQAPASRTRPEPKPAVKTKPVAETRPVIEPEQTVVMALDVEAEPNVEARPAAEVFEEVPMEALAGDVAAREKAEREVTFATGEASEQAVDEQYTAEETAAAEEAVAAAPKALAEDDLATQKKAALAAREATEVRTAEQAAAGRYAAEKAAAAEEAKLAVEEAVAAAPEALAEEDLATQRKAALAARGATEVRATEQAAAERYAAEKAAAAEEARLAAEQAAGQEQEARQAAAAEAERRARLAARRAEAQQLAAEQAAFQQAEAERSAAERAATEQEAASGEEGAQEVQQPDQYGAASGGDDAISEEVEGEASGVAGEQYGDVASGERQYTNGAEPTSGVQPAAPAAPATPAASAAPAAPAASGSVSGEAVVAEAAKYMGVPYVLNAASPSAMDCSGLTMLAYGAFGISLPDPPVAQYGVGVPVYGPPQAGDLVFYNEYGDGISHVAIATGRGTIIHASSYAGYVTESPIDAPAGRLPEARRVL